MVFRYEKSMKFANISGGFGGNLNFELIEKFPWGTDRKSTRLNSSHTVISYAVFCLKKKKASASTCDF